MSKSTLVALACLAIASVVFVLPNIAAVAARRGVEDNEVRKLQTERIKILERAVEVLDAQYRQGGAGIDQVIVSQQRLLDARLEIADTPAARLELLKARVKLASDQEAIAEARFSAAVGTEVDVLTAKAARLHAQIQVLQEQGS